MTLNAMNVVVVARWAAGLGGLRLDAARFYRVPPPHHHLEKQKVPSEQQLCGGECQGSEVRLDGDYRMPTASPI